MKIQDLAIISVIIIIPISLVLSVYTQYQIQTLNTQTLYDTKLTTATFDAIKAFQINTANSTMSDLSNSKLRDIEASVSTFKNSIMSTFGLKGYTQEDMNNFIPALVYTMYDGFYIYSPYENTNYLYEYARDATGNIITDASGNPTYEYEKDEAGNTKYDASGNPIKKSLDNNGETLYGLKPYITYSCRYQKNDIDVIITYSLDNYITVQGKIGGNYVNEEGYLIDGIEIKPDGTVLYNDVEIEKETLEEDINSVPYKYVKINGTKYYYGENIENQDGSKGAIFYLSNGKATIQGNTITGKTRGEVARDYYEKYILNNDAAIKYYKEADKFTDWVRDNLGELTYGDAYDLVYSEDTNQWNWKKIQTENQTTEWANKKIFDNNVNIENDLSNFNLHRLEVIRNKIESNLSIAIANYNKYSLATGIEFQLPKLKEEEWDLLINNISLISFVQGLDIGGKVYNGYTIVTNSETKEVVQEENIYILGTDSAYHRIGDKDLEGVTNKISDTTDIPAKSAGRLNLDFEKQKILSADGTTTRYYYPLRNYLGSYNSIVTQNEVTAFDDIYAYIQKQKDNGNIKLAKAFYTALGRERYGMYKALRTNMLYTDIQ